MLSHLGWSGQPRVEPDALEAIGGLSVASQVRSLDESVKREPVLISGHASSHIGRRCHHEHCGNKLRGSSRLEPGPAEDHLPTNIAAGDPRVSLQDQVREAERSSPLCFLALVPSGFLGLRRSLKPRPNPGGL
jgi:hypothetical protein